MRHARTVGVLFATLLAASCGEPDVDPKVRTREALGDIFLLAVLADPERLGSRLVYTGDDPTRRWIDVCDVSRRDERTYVERMGARITVLLGNTKPTWLAWSTETAPEGVWLRWHVRGANGSAWFSCLEIDGTIALADLAVD